VAFSALPSLSGFEFPPIIGVLAANGTPASAIDRTRALMDGSIQPDGIDLNHLNRPVGETFFRMLRHKEFEAAELSLSSCTVSMFNPARPFVAIPAIDVDLAYPWPWVRRT